MRAVAVLAVRSCMRMSLVTETFPPEVNGLSRTLHWPVIGLAGFGHQVTVLDDWRSAAGGSLCAVTGRRVHSNRKNVRTCRPARLPRRPDTER